MNNSEVCVCIIIFLCSRMEINRQLFTMVSKICFEFASLQEETISHISNPLSIENTLVSIKSLKRVGCNFSGIA